MQLLELKIKRMTLAAEARIIKAQESKALEKARQRAGILKGSVARKLRAASGMDVKNPSAEARDLYEACKAQWLAGRSNKPTEKLYATYEGLRDHRINVVRDAARAAHLANAYIKGVPYAKVEQSKYDYPAHRSYLVLSVQKDVRRFGGKRGENTTQKDISRWMDHGPTDWQKAAAEEADAQTTEMLEKAMAETGK